jgi:hypothetical protein
VYEKWFAAQEASLVTALSEQRTSRELLITRGITIFGAFGTRRERIAIDRCVTAREVKDEQKRECTGAKDTRECWDMEYHYRRAVMKHASYRYETALRPLSEVAASEVLKFEADLQTLISVGILTEQDRPKKLVPINTARQDGIELMSDDRVKKQTSSHPAIVPPQSLTVDFIPGLRECATKDITPVVLPEVEMTNQQLLSNTLSLVSHAGLLHACRAARSGIATIAKGISA